MRRVFTIKSAVFKLSICRKQSVVSIYDTYFYYRVFYLDTFKRFIPLIRSVNAWGEREVKVNKHSYHSARGSLWFRQPRSQGMGAGGAEDSAGGAKFFCFREQNYDITVIKSQNLVHDLY